MIVIDGNVWPVPCDVTRVSEVRPSEISGVLLDKTYFNDVMGTYLRYNVTLAVPTNMSNDYDALYESLTDPVDGHSFVMPYGKETIEVTARVERVEDALVYVSSKKQYWKGVRFQVVSNHPTKAMTLGEVLYRGLSPMPEAIGVPDGALYEMSSGTWVEKTYTNAEDVYY